MTKEDLKKLEATLGMNEELEKLNAEAQELEGVIGKNIRVIAGEE